MLFCTSTFWICATEAVFVKHMSHFFFLNTRYLSSKAHPHGSDNIFPLELLYFSPRPNLLWIWKLRLQGTREREGERLNARERKREKEFDLHVSTSIQTERQAGREA